MWPVLPDSREIRDADDNGGQGEAGGGGTAPAMTENRLTLDTDSHVYFYENDFYVLSNFSAFAIEWIDEKYPTSEHAYQAERFRGTDYDMFYRIMRAPSAHEAFRLAQANKHKQRGEWGRVKVGIMRSILLTKALQHQYVTHKLLATGDRILVEHSWRDAYWGWGPQRDGQNMLGQLWMSIRTELRATS